MNDAIKQAEDVLADMAWRPIAEVPDDWKSKSVQTPRGLEVRGVYLEGFCPDADEPHRDPKAAICIVWWEPGERKGKGAWMGEGGFHVAPSHVRPVRSPPGTSDQAHDALSALLTFAKAQREGRQSALHLGGEAKKV